MDNSIVSTEQRVSELSSALQSATALIKPLKLGNTAYSDFTVEGGFSSATNSAVTMNDLVRQIGVHVDSLLNSAAAMFVDTDSAIATKVLEEL
jgi:hypothetical protein